MFPALTGFYVDAETGVKVRPPVDPSLPPVTMEMIDMVTTAAPKGVRKQLKEKRDQVEEYVDKRAAELVSPSKPPVRRFLFVRPPIKKAPRKLKIKIDQAKGLRDDATCASSPRHSASVSVSDLASVQTGSACPSAASGRRWGWPPQCTTALYPARRRASTQRSSSLRGSTGCSCSSRSGSSSSSSSRRWRRGGA